MPQTHLGRLARDIHAAKQAGDYKRAAELSALFIESSETASRQRHRREMHRAEKATHVVVGDHSPEARRTALEWAADTMRHGR